MGNGDQMFKMIIADDEALVRDGLKDILPWNEYGIEVIALAVDGQEALELCIKHKPDILFTDIRMPIMDGLEVATELKKLGIMSKIIIFSGVEDFNYAKTALNVKAEGYILKPLKIPELIQTITRVVDSINQEKCKKFELIDLKQQLRESLPTLSEKFLRNWVRGAYEDENEIIKNFQQLNLNIQTGDALTIAVLKIDDYYNIEKRMTENDIQLLFFSILNIVNEIIANHKSGICSNIGTNEFIIIFDNPLKQKQLEVCNEISFCINKYLNIPMSMGIGQSIDDLPRINVSYNDALLALQYGFYKGNNSILTIDDIRNLKNDRVDMRDFVYSEIYDKENNIISYMKLGDVDKVEETIDELFVQIRSISNLPGNYIQNVCVEMLLGVSRAIYELNENIDTIVGSRTLLQETIYKTTNIYDLQNCIKTILSSITSYFSKKYTQKNTRVINSIKDIIKKHYRENIGVSFIAKEIYLSPNYISLIFKQETGENLTEYLTKLRMEKAKELLKESDLKVLDIAEYVGIENPHYFSTVFKKYTGMHPQKYRAFTFSE